MSSSLKEGFLLGTFEEKHVEIISDLSEGIIKPETVIRVSGIFPCSLTSKLFSQENGIDIPKQDDSVIVGWFSGRRNCLFKPSFRETAVHSKLNLQFNQNQTQRFLFVLVQDTLNETSLTCEFQAKFFKFDGGKRKWSSLVGSVLNWNQRSSLPNKSLYRSLSTLEPSLLACFEEQAMNEGLIGEELIKGIVSNAHNYLIKSLERIANISSEIAEVELQIARLKTTEGILDTKDISDNVNHDGNAFLAEDSADSPPSPQILSRRNYKKVPLSIDEEIDTCETTASTLKAEPKNSSLSKSPPQEY